MVNRIGTLPHSSYCGTHILVGNTNYGMCNYVEDMQGTLGNTTEANAFS